MHRYARQKMTSTPRRRAGEVTLLDAANQANSNCQNVVTKSVSLAPIPQSKRNSDEAAEIENGQEFLSAVIRRLTRGLDDIPDNIALALTSARVNAIARRRVV